MYKKIFLSSLFFSFYINSFVLAIAVSEQQELAIGKSAAMQTERQLPIINNAEITDYITQLGNNLVAHSTRTNIPYRFRVVDSKEINAFALPGGYIYVNRGLILNADNESELAGVLGHEIAHVTERHSAEQIPKSQLSQGALGLFGKVVGSRGLGGQVAYLGASLLNKGVFLKFGRDAEREADQVGANIVSASGWNPQGMITFFDKLAQKDRGGKSAAFFSSHPSPAEREANVSRLIAKLGNKGKIDSPEFQRFKKLLT